MAQPRAAPKRKRSRSSAFTSWQRRLPAGFRLSVKAPRALTHGRKLYAPEYWVGRITATWDRLYDRPGMLVVQLPPGIQRDDARLDFFPGTPPCGCRPQSSSGTPRVARRDVILLGTHQTAYLVI